MMKNTCFDQKQAKVLKNEKNRRKRPKTTILLKNSEKAPKYKKHLKKGQIRGCTFYSS
jgi:Ulp1 family protease